MQSQKKDLKNALRQKNRISAKEFIKMKRGKVKQEQNNSLIFEEIRKFIGEGRLQNFQQAIFQNKAQSVLIFFFSQNELKETPLGQIIKGPYLFQLLKIVNKWSLQFHQLIQKQIQKKDNEYNKNEYEYRFNNLNKLILQILNNRLSDNRQIQRQIIIIGQKYSLYYLLAKNFLNLELIISLLSNFKTKNDLLTSFYNILLNKSDLKEMQNLAYQISGYQSIILRQKIWNNVCSNTLKQVSLQKVQLIRLKYLNYNIWHQLANKNYKQFLQACSLLYSGTLGKQISEQFQKMLLDVDSSGQIALDKCLRLWKYAQIKELLQMSSKYQNIILSTNCLNKIFRNRKLNKVERQTLIKECISGEISGKGYVKIMIKSKTHQKKSQNNSQQNILLYSKPLSYTYNIIFSVIDVKKSKDVSGDYPLITYLKIYKQKCSVDIIRLLFIDALNPKYIKKSLNLLIKSTEQKRLQISNKNDKLIEIEDIYDYYQPIWKIATTLQHGLVLQYLLPKLHINCHEIKLRKKYNETQIQSIGNHFLYYYFQNNPFLGEDEINKKILLSIINCKQNQKINNKYNLIIQLGKSLSNLQKFHQSKEFLSVQIRKYIKIQLLKISLQDYCLQRQIWDKSMFIQILAVPMIANKKSFFTQEQFIQKFTPTWTKNLLEDGWELFYDKNKFQKFYIKLLKKFDPKQVIQPFYLGERILQCKNMLIAQQFYSEYYRPQNENKLFWDQLYNSLKQFDNKIKNSKSGKSYCFRLLPNEKYLVYKVKKLISIGIDCYFSRYQNKQKIIFNEIDSKLTIIFNKMIQKKCTFIYALLTEHTFTYDDISSLLINYYDNNSNQKPILTLIQRLKIYIVNIHRQKILFQYKKSKWNKIDNYYIDNFKTSFNFDMIIQIIKNYIKPDINIEMVQILHNYFKHNIDQYSYQIDRLMYQQKIKGIYGKQIRQKIDNLSKFVNKWMGYMIQIGDKVDSQVQKLLSEYQPKYILYNDLIQTANSKQQYYLVEILCKYYKLNTIPLRYCILKLIYDSNGEKQLIQFIKQINKQRLKQIIQNRDVQIRHKLSIIFKGYKLQSLKFILSKLLQIYFQSKQIIQPFINLLLRSVSIQNSIQMINYIYNIPLVKDDNINFLINTLIKTTQNLDLVLLSLILFNDNNKYRFNLKENKIIKYDTHNFYYRCNDHQFDSYLKILQKYSHFSKNIELHLRHVVNSLTQYQSWNRLQKLFKIQNFKTFTARLTLRTIYMIFGKIKKDKIPEITKIIGEILSYYSKAYKTEDGFDEDLFIAAFCFDELKAFNIFKPSKLSINGYRKCLQMKPQCSRLFLQKNISSNEQYIASSQAIQDMIKLKKRIGNWFPINDHYTYNFLTKKQPWLIDELYLQFKLAKRLDLVDSLRNTLVVFCTVQNILQYKNQIYNNFMDDKQIIRHILRCKQVESFEPYKKYFPNLYQMIRQQLIKERTCSKGNCINLSSINLPLLKWLINQKYLYSQIKKDLLSCFIRIIDLVNFELIQNFIKISKIQINNLFKQLQRQLNIFIWNHILNISNQQFIINFITRFNLFDIYQPQTYSQNLLNTICRYKWNQLLQFTIKYFEKKSNKKAIFAAQTIQNRPSLSKNAVFFLPIQMSINNNFYQTYFLIKSSSNNCPKFKISGRFLSEKDSKIWNYIPQMKRRVQLNNILMKTLRQAQNISFRFLILLPGIFELQRFRKEGVGEPTQVDETNQIISSNKYNISLIKFILGLINKTINLTYECGIFQKLCFMICNQQQTKIPSIQLQKKYPNQIKILNYLKQYIEIKDYKINLIELFIYIPQFKSLLFIYNPQKFYCNQHFMSQIIGIGQQRLDFSEYLKGVQINFIELKSKYLDILETYIQNYFFKSSIPIGHPKASHHLTRQALLLIFLEIGYYQRNFTECVIFNICQRNIQGKYETSQEILYQISRCLNIRGNDEMSFDLMVWNKIISGMKEIQQFWRRMGKQELRQYKFDVKIRDGIIDNYCKVVLSKLQRFNIINLFEILNNIYEFSIKNGQKKGAYLQLTINLNIFLLLSDLKVLDDKLKSIKGGRQIEKYHIKLVKQLNQKTISYTADGIIIQVKYNIQLQQINHISLIMIDYFKTLQVLQHELYLSNLQQKSEALLLNQYCSKQGRHSFLKNYKFRYNFKSFQELNLKNLSMLLQHESFSDNGIIGKSIYELQKIQQRLLGTKNIKIYNVSDIYGPINFSDQKDNNKIIDCLGFYQLVDLPKQNQIIITYTSDKIDYEKQNILLLKQIRNYIDYYLSIVKDEIVKKLDINYELMVRINREGRQQKVQIDWNNFGGWIICELYCIIIGYCSQLSIKIQKMLDVRISFINLIQYYERYLQIGQKQNIKISIQKLIYQKQFNLLIQSIIIMITQDVSNIMRIVKGIIIKWSINDNKAKRRANLIISNHVSIISIDYEVKSEILNIILNLEMNKNINKDRVSDELYKLVDRKQFLNKIFVSAQFLTDYFLVKHQLNNICLNISTSISQKLNSTINFHIEYSNLYKYIQKIRDQKPIKDIELLLVRLKQYLNVNIQKSINTYLSSQQLANKQQIYILNKCQAINNNISYEQIQNKKLLIYDSLNRQPVSGLYQSINLMNQIGNQQSIKNTFLIQIYKSYYTTMVGEGMTFVVGYKSSKKKSQVIKITKLQNINLINIVQLDFIMLLSKYIPTNDELNSNKIIRIFITDSNKNLYRLNSNLKNYFLNLQQQNQQRNISYFSPLISSNIKLNFIYNNEIQKDNKDIKIFNIQLNDQYKYKILPNIDKILSPINSCKKNIQYKQSIQQLLKYLYRYMNNNIKIIIDFPQEINEKYININFSHIIHLLTIDIQQFLFKFQFQPMRNQYLDCKLSIQYNFIINKNSIIQLRKKTLYKHYNKIRIRVRDQLSIITFNDDQIIINIDTNKMNQLASSSQYLSVIIDQILNKQKKILPKQVQFISIHKNQSTQILLKQFDIFNIIPYQIQQLKKAITLINMIYHTQYRQYKIIADKKKSQIIFKDIIEIYFNVQTVQRQFYTSQEIIKQYIKYKNKNYQPNISAFTYFNPLTKNIIIQDCLATNYKIIFEGQDNNWKMLQIIGRRQNSKIIIQLNEKYKMNSKYILIQQQNIYSNYFCRIDESRSIKSNLQQGIRNNNRYLYLQNNKRINLNFCNISFIQIEAKHRQQINDFNILKYNGQKNKINIKLISNNIYFIDILYQQSMILKINYGSNYNIYNNDINNTQLIIKSDGQIDLNNTKFIQLVPYKKKSVLIKQKQNQNINIEFRQGNQLVQQINFQTNKGDINNIQNLVYVVNDQCKKYLTRAGQQRIDYIQFCDKDNNLIDYKHQFDVLFVHINKLDIIKPKIIQRNNDFGLVWTPIIRGHYYLYINKMRMNPPYQIGVCAAQADYKKTTVTIPKIHKICYCQQSQLMLDLRDQYNNLYTQIQQDILGDSLLIELKCSQMSQNLKVQKSQINKYGLKKIKFSFNNAQAEKTQDIDITVQLNCQIITVFTISVDGLSLKQRKKLLEKAISQASKNYYKEIVVRRYKFLEDLFTIAQKSLHTNLSVKFANQPGIDAGGVKRQFYDMVGNQLKNQNNPFFKLIDPKTMQYFLNPQILRNKKKLEYMSLWGKYIANSFLNSYLIGINFSPVFMKLVIDQAIDYQDLLSVLPLDERKQYQYLLKASPQQIEDLDLYFTAMIDKKKCVQIQLVEGGKDRPVKASNVKQYLQCMAKILITDRYKDIINAFKQGFETVLQLAIFKRWLRPTQFWCLTAGNKEITPELVLNYVVFQGNKIQNVSAWFRRFITESNHEILVGFLKFSSGSSSIDFTLTNKITVSFENAGQNPKKLPISHTCWKEIVVPKYKSYEIMKKLLTAAFIYCSEGFGFG